MIETLIVYHDADFDGLISAEITGFSLVSQKAKITDYSKAVKWIEDNIEYFPYNYQKERETDLLELINNQPEIKDIFFVDCLMLNDTLIKDLLDRGIKVHTYDHHETSYYWQMDFIVDIQSNFQLLDNFDFQSINSSNMSLDLAESSTGLCFKKLISSGKMPQTIALISAYDIWNKQKFNWDEETLPFQYGLRTIETLNMKNVQESIDSDDFISHLIFNSTISSVSKDEEESFVKMIIDKGLSILKYVQERNIKVANLGKDIVFKIIKEDRSVEKYKKCFIAGDYCNNSLLFEYGLAEANQYQLLILVKPNIFSTEKLSVSIITSIHNESSTEEISAEKICRIFGGGGHQGIGGCQFAYSWEKNSETDQLTLVAFANPKLKEQIEKSL